MLVTLIVYAACINFAYSGVISDYEEISGNEVTVEIDGIALTIRASSEYLDEYALQATTGVAIVVIGKLSYDYEEICGDENCDVEPSEEQTDPVPEDIIIQWDGLFLQIGATEEFLEESELTPGISIAIVEIKID